MNATAEDQLARLLLRDSISEFFATEYDLLDRRELSEWLALFAEDAVYAVPLQRNVKYDHLERENALGPLDTAWFADTKDTLSQRVEQIQTGVHWAEEPVSRSAHLVTNVRIVERSPQEGAAQTVSTRCRILVYRNRLEREVDLFVGIREDKLRRRGATWEIVERTVFLEQNVLLAKNLTLFFKENAVPSVRVLYCSNQRDLPERLERLRERAAAVRAEPGCLEFDTFRDVEHPENFAQLELWENPPAFDAHWERSGAAGILCAVDHLLAPHHRGTPDYPRRDGTNGAEFYRYQTFTIAGQIFVSTDPGERIESLRWPSRSGVRIIIQSSTDPAGDRDFFPYAAETRAQKGCLEFAFYRSLEFPENNLHLELWQGPPAVYDEHFYLRTLHRLYGSGLARPPSTSLDRRYGLAGFEFYQHGFFAPAGDVWQPENPAERLATVRWT